MTIELKEIHPGSAEALAGFRAGLPHFGNETNPDPPHDAEEIEKQIRQSLDRDDPHVLAWDGSEVVGESRLRRVHFEGMGHTAGLSVEASGPFPSTGTGGLHVGCAASAGSGRSGGLLFI